MNEQELQSILNKLSAQAESIKKKQDITKQIEKLDVWIKLLTEKATELSALNVTPIVDVASKLVELKTERADLQSMLIPASIEAIKSLVDPMSKIVPAPEIPALPGPMTVIVEPVTEPDPAPEPTPAPAPVIVQHWNGSLSEEELREMEGLLQVMETLDLDPWSHGERWTQYDSWASQWPRLVSRHPANICDLSPLLRQVYGKTRDLMKGYGPPLWYIEGLDRNRKADWEVKYKSCELKLREMAAARKEQLESEGDEKEQAIWTLMNLVREYPEAKDREKATRKLRHQIRETAKFKHLREEVAEVVEPLRSMLESEFSFLWPKNMVEETLPTRSMTNRDLVARLLRRMKAKTLIGACHGPFEQIYKGVPEQDKGRAKELLEQLGKLGVIRFKGSIIGIRVSLEPRRMPVIDLLINGEDTSVQAINTLLYAEMKV